MRSPRSYTTLLIIGAVIIHLILMPVLFSGILLYIKSSYSEQFIDNIRSSTNLIASQLSHYDFAKERDDIGSFLDDLLLGGQVTFAEISLSDGTDIKPMENETDTENFKEDFYFAEHDDDAYYIKTPIESQVANVRGTLRLGFDESLIQEHIDTARNRGFYIAFVYLVITIIALLIIIPRSTSSLRKIQHAARKVAQGDDSKTLNIKSQIKEFSQLAGDLEQMRLELVSQKEHIERRKTYISAIMNNMAEPMIIMDQSLMIDSVNPAAEKVFGYSLQEIKGKPYKSLVADDGCSGDCAIRALTENSVSQCDGLRKDGTSFPVEFRFSHFVYGDQNLIICNAHDMTEHKKHEVELVQARTAAESANLSKSIFLSSMSHELRTPLNAIIGYSEIMLEEAEDNNEEAAINDLTKIRNSGKHLLSLINTILDLSKIEAGKMETHIEEIDIKGMIDDVVDTVEPLFDKNNNRFEVKFNTERAFLNADFTKVKQALINLIGNANKFTSDGLVTLTIDEQPIHGENNIIFSVADTGIGIAEEDQGRIFEEFSQANTKVSSNYGGTGLGLVISRKFCRMMGGDIHFTSQENVGSTFTINIPTTLKKETNK